jgi:hypothetical protein
MPPLFFCVRLLDFTVLKLALDAVLCCSTSDVTTVFSSIAAGRERERERERKREREREHDYVRNERQDKEF